jgi:hypothetical protein
MQYRNSKKGSIGELETVVGQDGQPILVPRSMAVGQRPYLKEDSKPLIMPEGSVLLDPATGKPVYKNPRSETPGKGGAAEPLTEESAQMEGFKYILTGKLPFTGMSGKGRTQMINAGWKIAKENGWTRKMVLRMQSDYKAMDKSVTAQRKNYDAMNGFVINMDRQMDRLEEAYSKLPRSQYRLLNIPIVELRKRAAGSGEEAAAKAILIELGNESGKLSTNSASSIRELSESAQKQWEKIHDGYLSFNDLKKVLETQGPWA